MNDSISRFSDRVANYVKYRPDYPREIVDHLKSERVMNDDSIIADVGSGPGISSKIFLKNGNKVFGVEPNAAMREAATEYLQHFSNFISVDGNAHATTLSDGSIDLIVAAQAFHWFDPNMARNEFRRILSPNGQVVLIWNERRLDADDFHREYEALLLKYANDYGSVRHENIAEEQLRNFYVHDFSTLRFDNQQEFDFDGIKGRMLSSSYMPNTDSPRYGELVKDLEAIFAKHERNGKIRVLYDTNVYHSTV
ncbi:MAG TPA: class I SAM-dependent methyltransferase [Pyrinomonadaceae bacterium]|nr:class I SAM-dependent methyltransferase [Pyrinomonadaceae bacterium]